MVYSGASGFVSGGFIGRSASPNKESDNFNTAIGALTGAAVGAALGYFFWSDANPDLKLKTPIIPDETKKLAPLKDPSISFKNLGVPSYIKPIGGKNYFNSKEEVPKEILDSLKKQYYRVYETKNEKIKNGNKVYIVPSHKVFESGVE